MKSGIQWFCTILPIEFPTVTFFILGEQTKEWFEGYSVEDVLTFGQKDIMENWPIYRKRFIKELRK